MLIASSVLLIGTAVGLIYYWVDFYMKGRVQAVDEDWYIRFQKAFTVADLWTAVCAIIGAIGLLTGQAFGALFAVIAASSLIFLGLMDVTFNIQNIILYLKSHTN